MVIGERFAWAHLPKAAGSTTQELFRLFPELVQFADPDDGNDKHAPFRDRSEQVQGKILALNIRRLPTWVLSRAQYVARWGVWPDYVPIPMDSPKALSESSFPDSRLQLYMDDGRLSIDRWLRVERLQEDFLSFVSDFCEVDPERRAQVVATRPVNTQSYDREVDSWFTPEQLRTMYESNPVWAEFERKLYGDLIYLK
jgi:hypothetical protein